MNSFVFPEASVAPIIGFLILQLIWVFRSRNAWRAAAEREKRRALYQAMEKHRWWRAFVATPEGERYLKRVRESRR